MVKNLPADAGDAGLIPGSERYLVKEMATHYSILAWKIPWSLVGPWSYKESDDLATEQQVYLYMDCFQ